MGSVGGIIADRCSRCTCLFFTVAFLLLTPMVSADQHHQVPTKAAEPPPKADLSLGACTENSDSANEDYQHFDFLAERKPANLTGDETVLGIVFHRQNVFPDADGLLSRAANRLNFLTRESTLRAALPFVVGDSIRDTHLEEAERVLRQQKYLYDARVLVQERCPAGIIVGVVVRDVWTLTPSVSFSRAGGDNKSEFGVTDANVLGLGKALSLGYRSDLDRSGTTFSYFDPNALGSRWIGSLTITDNDDGEIYATRIERPFFALDSDWATGVRVTSLSREQPLEYLSEALFDIETKQDSAEVYFGRSAGRVGNRVNRFTIGMAFVDERYRFPADFPDDPLVERRFVYPFIGWQHIEDRFVTRANLDRVDRTEDVQLGLQASARLGWSSNAIGGEDGDTLLYRAAASQRWYLTDSQLLGFSATLSGRYAIDSGNGSEDVVALTSVDYLWRHGERFSLYARLRVEATRDLDPESQLTLGGDTDLRGYPSRFQPGDHSYLATLEERYYSDWFPFGLFRVGIAAFVDVGRAWFEDEAPNWIPDEQGDHFGTLANVGVGLRLESVRTRRDRVYHIDLAHPLVDGPGVDGFQITLSAKTSL